jgi:hypothetical protein
VAKGLLRKALHGAAKSSSELLGAHIEEARQKRLADYGFSQEKELEGLRHSNTLAANQQQIEANTAADQTRFTQNVALRGIEQGFNTQNMETQVGINRESAEFEHGLRMEEEGARAANQDADAQTRFTQAVALAGIEQGFARQNAVDDVQRQIDFEEAKAKIQAQNPDVKVHNMKTPVLNPDSGLMEPYETSVAIFPDGTVKIFDPATSRLVTPDELDARSENEAYQINAAKALEGLMGARRKAKVQEIKQEFESLYPDRELDIRALPKDVQDWWRNEDENPAPEDEATTRTPTPAQTPSDQTNLLSLNDLTPEQRRTITVGEIQARRDVQWLLDKGLNDGRMPSRSFWNTPRVRRALESGLLTPTQKTIVEQWLGATPTRPERVWPQR